VIICQRERLGCIGEPCTDEGLLDPCAGEGLFDGQVVIRGHFFNPPSDEMRGQVVIARQLPEMSLLVLLVLLTLLMGIIDFSRVFNGEIHLSQAAREGARIVAMGTLAGVSSIQVIARAVGALNSPVFQVKAPNVSVDVVNSAGAVIMSGAVWVDSTNLARVTITIAYNKIMWSPSTLTKPAVMRCAG
jgi:hypothetical protein